MVLPFHWTYIKHGAYTALDLLSLVPLGDPDMDLGAVPLPQPVCVCQEVDHAPANRANRPHHINFDCN